MIELREQDGARMVKQVTILMNAKLVGTNRLSVRSPRGSPTSLRVQAEHGRAVYRRTGSHALARPECRSAGAHAAGPYAGCM